MTAAADRFGHARAYRAASRPETRELLIVYHAAPGTPTVERLQLLASL